MIVIGIKGPTHWLCVDEHAGGDLRDCLKASFSWMKANTNTYGAYSPPGTWPLLCLIDPQAVETVSSGLWLNAGWGRFQGNIPVSLVGNFLSLHSGWKHKEQQRQVTCQSPHLPHLPMCLHLCLVLGHATVRPYSSVRALPHPPFTTNTITYTPGWIIFVKVAT